MKKLIIGTRRSKLALWQAQHVQALLQTTCRRLEVELQIITTTGDKILDMPLAKIGGKGLFTKEIENELLSGKIDLAVHSLKDMPAALPEGLVLTAITKREDPRDAFVSKQYSSLAALPQGARVGTSSLRRKAQLLYHRPDLTIVDLRGNVDSRLRKLEEEDFAAIILAAAGLERLGLADSITEYLSTEICLPAVGQGALAIETRSDAAELREVLKVLDDQASHAQALAERAFLREVEGGCQIPVGVQALCTGNEEITVTAIIASVDGSKLLRQTLRGRSSEAKQLGTALAREMLAAGGKKILDAILSC